MSISKIGAPGEVLQYMPDLVHYCTSQPDNSSQVFAKRISGTIMKFLNDRQDTLFEEQAVEQYSEEYGTFIDQLFISIVKYVKHLTPGQRE